MKRPIPGIARWPDGHVGPGTAMEHGGLGQPVYREDDGDRDEAPANDLYDGGDE